MIGFKRCRVCGFNYDLRLYPAGDVPLDADRVCDGCRSFGDEEEPDHEESTHE